MTKEQFKIIVAALKSNYRTFGITDKAQFDFWYSMLQDIPYEVLTMAVKKLVCEFTYPPTIADIRKRCVDVTENTLDQPIDIWNKAFRLISRASVVTQEEFDSLEPQLRRYFGNLANLKEHGTMTLDTINSVTKGQFLKQVKSNIDTDREHKQLPNDLKAILGNVNNKMLGE